MGTTPGPSWTSRGLGATYGIDVNYHFLFNESLITRARNYIADEFLRSNHTHLMFIDSDIGFAAKDVLSLAALQSDESDYDIICGPYPKKVISWEKIKLAVDKGGGGRRSPSSRGVRRGLRVQRGERGSIASGWTSRWRCSRAAPGS